MMKGKLQWPPPPLPNTPGQVERLVMERWRRKGENIFEVLYLTGGRDED